MVDSLPVRHNSDNMQTQHRNIDLTDNARGQNIRRLSLRCDTNHRVYVALEQWTIYNTHHKKN